jgi:hypothetical protein
MSKITTSNISGYTPNVNQLPLGDILINTYDGKVYIKKTTDKERFIIELGSNNNTNNIINTGSLLANASVNLNTITFTRGNGSTFPITINTGSGGSSTPGGAFNTIQFNNGGLFSGSSNFTLLNNNALYLTGSLNVSGSIVGNLTGTSSQATTASYALNGGVTQLLAGANISLSPSNGLGQVTITSTGGSGGTGNTSTGSYGSFYDTTTQTNPVGNIPRSMSFNTTDITNGVSISGSTSPFNTYIKTQNAGVYDIQFSAQLDKTDSGTDEIVIWLRKNGSNLTDTATTVTLVGNNAKNVAAWNWFVNSAANDYYQIIWQSPDTNVRLFAEPADGHPGIPSVILTVNRVDQFLSNTGSFSGSFTGQLFGTSSWASNAVTASYIVTAQTASYVLNAVSSSFAVSSSRAVSSSFALTSSFPWFQTGSNVAYVGRNVGIGTTTPSTNLTVSSGSAPTLKLENTTNLGTTLWAGTTVSSIDFSVTDPSSPGTYGRISTVGGPGSTGGGLEGDLTFSTTPSNSPGSIAERLRINSTGNVGIGITTPTSRLQVRGSGTTSATTALRVENSSAAARLTISDIGDTAFNTNHLYVSSSGAVGISTATPTYTLEVNGPIYSSPGQILITASGSVNKEGAFIAASTSRTVQVGISDNSTVPVGIDMFAPNNSFPSSYINFRVNNADLVRMTGSFIGIGTTSPTVTLDISGSGRFTNGLTVTGSLIAPTITGSLQGTSSWANNTISSSFALTASLAPLYVLNSRTSSFATTGSNTFKDNQIVTGSITSTTDIRASGNIEAQVNLKSMNQSGDEGGEIFLNAPATNTTIPTGVTIDVYQNRLRIFEQGGAANGYYLEMPSGSASAGTNLKPAGFTGTVTIFGNPPPNNLNFTDGILINIT